MEKRGQVVRRGGATEDGPGGTGCESASFDAAVLSRFKNQD